MKVRCECKREVSDMNGLGCIEVRVNWSKANMRVCSKT